MPDALTIETAPLVLDVGVVLMVAATLGLVARRLGLPAIIGYLVTGLLVSPFTPGYAAGSTQLAVLADIGVVLLLFEVGIEIDLGQLRQEQRAVFWAAPLQVATGLLVGTPVFIWLGVPAAGAVLLALGVAMSSSIVIVNITRSRRRTTNPATETAMLGWSVTQDIFGVATAAVVLTVVGIGDQPLPVALLGLFGFVALAYVSSRALPWLLRLVKWEHDLFLIYSVSIGLAVAALGTVAFGIPMALAAFVAGLALNQGHVTDEIRRVIMPFRDLFAVLFFVVIGSLVAPDRVLAALPFAGVLFGLLLLAKTLPAYLITRLSGVDARAPQLAVGLSQIGEFSFVLGSAALGHGLLTQDQFTAVLLVVVASIVASTLVVKMFRPLQHAR